MIQRLFQNAVTSIIQRIIKLTRLTGAQRRASVRWSMPSRVNTSPAGQGRTAEPRAGRKKTRETERERERKRKREEEEEQRHSGRALKIHAWPPSLSRTHISWLAKAARCRVRSACVCIHQFPACTQAISVADDVIKKIGRLVRDFMNDPRLPPRRKSTRNWHW